MSGDIQTVNLSNSVSDFIIPIIDKSGGKGEDSDTKNHAVIFKLLDDCKKSIDENTLLTKGGVENAQRAIAQAKKALNNKDAESEAKKAKDKADEAKKSKTVEDKPAADQNGGFLETQTAVETILDNDKTYTYAGEVTTHHKKNTLNGVGVVILGTKEEKKPRVDMLSKDTYSYSGQFVDGKKDGFGIETGLNHLLALANKTSDNHYYVGKFDEGKRCGGAYAIGENRVYIGDFGEGMSTFRGFGCWRQEDQIIFGKFMGTQVGNVDAKLNYPLIYARGNDIRRYDSAGSKDFVIFEPAVREKIREKINSITLHDVYKEMGLWDETLYELKRPLESLWNYNTTTTATKVIGITALLAAAYGVYKGFQWWNRKPEIKSEIKSDIGSGVNSSVNSGVNSSVDGSYRSTKKNGKPSRGDLEAECIRLGIKFSKRDNMKKLEELINQAKQSQSAIVVSNRRSPRGTAKKSRRGSGYKKSR